MKCFRKKVNCYTKKYEKKDISEDPSRTTAEPNYGFAWNASQYYRTDVLTTRPNKYLLAGQKHFKRKQPVAIEQ